MKNNTPTSTLEKTVDRLGLARYKRHIFICTGEKCCSAEQGASSWNHLKARCKELGLTDQGVFRTKARCLRVCQKGPIAVVYPEGVWYQNVDEAACEKIISEHLVGGAPVSEHILAKNKNFS